MTCRRSWRTTWRGGGPSAGWDGGAGAPPRGVSAPVHPARAEDPGMAFTVGAATYAWLWDRPLEYAIDRIAELGFRRFEAMTASPHVWPRAMDGGARPAPRRASRNGG